MKLSERVARVEKLVANGVISGRDLEVIRRQVARAEAKLVRKQRGSATSRPILDV
jgi:hypothetical protein